MTATLLLGIGTVAIFASLLLGLAAVGIFNNEARGVSRSLAVVEAFSTAPKALQDELEPSFQERVLNPLLDRCVELGKKFTPADHVDRIRQKLEIAGNPEGWTVDRVMSLKFVGLVAGLGLGIVTSVLMGLGLPPTIGLCLMSAVAGYFGPNLYLYQKGYDRTAQMQKALPDALDLLTISVEAGLGFDSAISQVAKNTKGPLADEFARLLQEMQIGLGRGEALRALGERSTLPEFRSFISAMVQADAFGIPIGQVLRVQSREIRVKRRQRAEELAMKVPVKILAPLIFCILPCLFIAVMGPAALTMMEALSGTSL